MYHCEPSESISVARNRLPMPIMKNRSVLLNFINVLLYALREVLSPEWWASG